METYQFSSNFECGGLRIQPVHLRVEELRPVIAAHRHANTSYEIHYTAAGRGAVQAGDGSYRVEPGLLYVTGPGVVHAQRSDPACPITEYCLYLHCRRISFTGKEALAPFADTAFWIGRDDGAIRVLLEQLLEEQRRQRADAWEMSKALLIQTVVRLSRLYRAETEKTAGAPERGRSREAMLPLIEDAFFYHYDTLTPAELSGLLHLSVRQMQRLLQSAFGKTFSQKLTDARMAAAKEMLANTGLSVTTISEKLGFSSMEHFSAAFRRYTGDSPTVFRRKAGEMAQPPAKERPAAR